MLLPSGGRGTEFRADVPPRFMFWFMPCVPPRALLLRPPLCGGRGTLLRPTEPAFERDSNPRFSAPRAPALKPALPRAPGEACMCETTGRAKERLGAVAEARLAFGPSMLA
jgi:hypothetical protein